MRRPQAKLYEFADKAMAQTRERVRLMAAQVDMWGEVRQLCCDPEDQARGLLADRLKALQRDLTASLKEAVGKEPRRVLRARLQVIDVALANLHEEPQNQNKKR